MQEQEEEWKADVEATIAMKDARSKMVQREREEMIQEVNDKTKCYTAGSWGDLMKSPRLCILYFNITFINPSLGSYNGFQW